MKDGYILLYRKIFDNPILNIKPFCKGYAWIILCLLANRETGYISVKNGEKLKILRGECGYSQKALADIFGWSRGKVARWLLLLEKNKMIQQKNVSNHTIIRIIRYNLYQMKQQNKKNNQAMEQQNNIDTIGFSNAFLKKIEQQTDIHIEQQNNIKMEQQNNAVNKDYIYISKSELEKIIQQKILETDTKTNTNKEYINTNSYINISSSSSIDLTKEEEELLKSHSKRNKIKYFKPWLRKIVENGDYKELLEKEKRLQAKEEKKKKEVEAEEVIETPEDLEKIKEIQKRIKERSKRR